MRFFFVIFIFVFCFLAFNSLYEIQVYENFAICSTLNFTFNSLYEIQVEKIKLIDTYRYLSILFMRFVLLEAGLMLIQNTPFNSLYEIPLHLLTVSHVLIAYLSILFMRFNVERMPFPALSCISFNSLYEIPWGSGYTGTNPEAFNSLYEIPLTEL